jgi:hypothetical protein
VTRPRRRTYTYTTTITATATSTSPTPITAPPELDLNKVLEGTGALSNTITGDGDGVDEEKAVSEDEYEADGDEGVEPDREGVTDALTGADDDDTEDVMDNEEVNDVDLDKDAENDTVGDWVEVTETDDVTDTVRDCDGVIDADGEALGCTHGCVLHS